MEENKKEILNALIKEHIETSLPISSQLLVEKYQLNISSATARQRMVELEDEGYIYQPHISAGRIPTEKAYRFYLENLQFNSIKSQEFKKFSNLLKDLKEENLKQVARDLAKETDLAVFWAINQHNLFYTGISNLFHQREFTQIARVYDISAVIDELENILNKIYNDINWGVQTFIGSQNPFGHFCSSILVKYKVDKTSGMFGIIGPLRMNYKKNIQLCNYLFNLINSK